VGSIRRSGKPKLLKGCELHRSGPFIKGSKGGSNAVARRAAQEQIIAILKEHETGMKTADLCRKHGISEVATVSVQLILAKILMPTT
jgi:hypothetical protein